ncbi:MAG: PhoX family protein [Actinomycetota bacterium]|nr:PhoX family protein [Actinomycetota bacterium]
MSTISRRGLLGRGAAVAGGAAVSTSAAQALMSRNAYAAPGNRGRAGKGDGGYGPLQPAGPELALPAGFTYVKFGVEGSIMSDGNPTPKAHDGMAALPLPNGNVRLIRNHEDRDTAANSIVKGDPSTAYDKRGGGSTTSLEVEPGGDRELVRDFISLNGTIVNCAGGPTPQNSWITCEETTAGQTQGFAEDHGYNFEVPASAEDEVDAVPLKAMGRFVHEAIAVDPRTGIVFETEDRGTSGFYRFIPDSEGDLTAGRLQMLAIKGRPNYDTRTGQRVGKPLPVRWVDIEDPDPSAAETNPLAVFEQGKEEGGATFSRLEGCWYGDGSVFFSSTDGGEKELGQVWQYRPRGNSGGQLILLFESRSADQLDAPDNVTVTPGGGIILCEDGDGDQFLRGLTQRGRIFDFAQNINNDPDDAREFAGATFSPDGDTLFVNIQGDTRGPGSPDELGMTFAIWGPFEDGAL